MNSISAYLYKSAAFGISSLTAFATDFSLYAFGIFLLPEGWGYVLVANIVARIVSATINFTINRLWVFRSRGPLHKEIQGYTLLSLAILAGNTTVLHILTEVVGENVYMAKLFVELMFFVVSFIVQQTGIFKDTLENTGVSP